MQRSRKCKGVVFILILGAERSCVLAGKLAQQRLIEPDPGLEVFDGEVFIGRVDLCVGQRKTEQQSIDTEDIAEGLHDWNAATLADEHGLRREGGAQGGLGGKAEF